MTKNNLNQSKSNAFSLAAELYLFTKRFWVITLSLCLLCGYVLTAVAQDDDKSNTQERRRFPEVTLPSTKAGQQEYKFIIAFWDDEFTKEEAKQIAQQVDAIASGAKLTKADAARTVPANKDADEFDKFIRNKFKKIGVRDEDGDGWADRHGGDLNGDGGIAVITLTVPDHSTISMKQKCRDGCWLYRGWCMCFLSYDGPKLSTFPENDPVFTWGKRTMSQNSSNTVIIIPQRSERDRETLKNIFQSLAEVIKNNGPYEQVGNVRYVMLPAKKETTSIKILFLYKDGSVDTSIVNGMVGSLDAEGLEVSIKSGLSTRVTNSVDYGVASSIVLRKVKGDGIIIPSSIEMKSNPIDSLFKQNGNLLIFNVVEQLPKDAGTWLTIKTKSSPHYKQSKSELYAVLMDNKQIGIKDGSIENERVIVFTFNQTPQTIEEFKNVFCKAFHNDCGGPIGKPIELKEPITVKSYFPIDYKGEIKNEQDVLTAILPYTRPPESLLVVLDSSTVVSVSNLTFKTSGSGNALGGQKPVVSPDGKISFKNSNCCPCGSGTLALCPLGNCPECCRGTGKPIPFETFARLHPERVKEVDSALSLMALKRAEGNKVPPKIDVSLIGGDVSTQNYIICVYKPSGGPCLAYKVCLINEGQEHCYYIYWNGQFWNGIKLY